MSNAYRRTIDECEESRKLVKEFMENVRLMAGCLIESTEPGCAHLLSSNLRRLFRDRAQMVDEQYWRLVNHLCADMPKHLFKSDQKESAPAESDER